MRRRLFPWTIGHRAVVSACLLSAIALGLAVSAASDRARPRALASEATASGAPLHADLVRGVNHAHVHRRGRGYGSDRSAQTLTELRQLGVNWIAITPFGYQQSISSDHLRGFPGDPGEVDLGETTGRSMRDDDLGREIAAAHARDIKVLIKPHVWSRDFRGGAQWHGSIDQDSPEARDRWWRSYRQFVLHYARLAAAHDADALCLGTELVKMTEGAQRQREWRALIAEVRQVYDGPLTYAAHWDEEFGRIEFWDELDAVGIAAYFPLAAPRAASVAELVKAWRPHCERIAAVHARFEKPIVFLEAGYRPVEAAHLEPWLHSGGAPDDAAQARAYRAMFTALADEPWWRGVFLWKTFTDPSRGEGGSPDFVFRGRPAEAVIRQWYGGE